MHQATQVQKKFINVMKSYHFTRKCTQLIVEIALIV